MSLWVIHEMVNLIRVCRLVVRHCYYQFNDFWLKSQLSDKVTFVTCLTIG